MKYLLSYLCIINALGFLIMLIDKRKARKNQWRIPESTLMLVAALGGSIGTLIGMYSLRHKTKHAKFYIGVPFFLTLQVGLAVAIYVILK